MSKTVQPYEQLPQVRILGLRPKVFLLVFGIVLMVTNTNAFAVSLFVLLVAMAILFAVEKLGGSNR